MTTSVHARRDALVNWLHKQSGGAPYTIAEIVATSNIYGGHGQYDTCRRDLLRLKANGVVKVYWPSSPTRWGLA